MERYLISGDEETIIGWINLRDLQKLRKLNEYWNKNKRKLYENWKLKQIKTDFE